MILIKNSYNKQGILQEFSDEENFSIFIKDDFVQTEYYYQYTDDFDYVDGEEGDNGDIIYFDENLNIVAINTIYGGDRNNFEFTEIGKQLLKTELQKYLNWLLYENCHN